MAFRKIYNLLCSNQTFHKTYLHNGIPRYIQNPLNVTLLERPIKKIMSWNIQELFWYSNPKKLNIEETIASSKENYVEIAVKLSKDNEFRNSI